MVVVNSCTYLPPCEPPVPDRCPVLGGQECRVVWEWQRRLFSTVWVACGGVWEHRATVGLG